MGFSEKHFFLNTCSDIYELATPIIKLLGLNRFSFVRIYADGRAIILSTSAEWIMFGYKKKYYQIIEYYMDLVSVENKKMILLDRVELSPLNKKYIEENRKIFNCSSYFSIVEKFNDYFEIVHFTAQDIADPMVYFSQIDLIEKFLIFFKNDAMPIIVEAKKHAIDTGRNKKALCNVDNDKFSFMSRSLNLNVSIENRCVVLSAQETICAALLMQGRSYKNIANIMALSLRTIESYMNNIQKKINCYSKQRLIKDLGMHKNFLDLVLTEDRVRKIIQL